jgi:hypothetical protein
VAAYKEKRSEKDAEEHTNEDADDPIPDCCGQCFLQNVLWKRESFLRGALLPPHRAQIDSQLFCLFVKMTALQPQ